MKLAVAEPESQALRRYSGAGSRSAGERDEEAHDRALGTRGPDPAPAHPSRSEPQGRDPADRVRDDRGQDQGREPHADDQGPLKGLFLPGWAARATLYEAAMPEGWEAIDPPSFAETRGSLEAYRGWLEGECRARPGPLSLGGHSLGAALAILVAAEGNLDVERLVLVNPAGLPLGKPAALMLFDFLRRLLAGWFPPGEAARSAGAVLSHPALAHRLGQEVRRLDLSDQLEQVRRLRVPCTVVAASTDTLTPPELCRRIASAAGGEYRELEVGGGHLWFLREAELLKRQLADAPA